MKTANGVKNLKRIPVHLVPDYGYGTLNGVRDGKLIKNHWPTSEQLNLLGASVIGHAILTLVFGFI